MKSKFAATMLTLFLTMNLGSGWTQRLDHQIWKIESSLRDAVETRVSTEQLLDAERKCRSRAQVTKEG
ncbi:hypothetical protein [Desulfovibrio sp. TomC]|uniref:hypothetical protein n=1 Tax=Desulfovibrio sp. TomC TaxID=1562888 RepID=UPI000574714B|nr:hypothetical protein [Desulfovibrio sp. TomC]KHK00607.1 hypothetical protein NY78_3977 [Desulfovibrio sp. TomC]